MVDVCEVVVKVDVLVVVLCCVDDSSGRGLVRGADGRCWVT